MPSPPTLDIEALLVPIPGENPAGESLLNAELYDTIKKARQEGDDRDPLEPKIKTANWSAVIALATEALATKSKDLQLAAWLAEALVKRQEFPGLRDSLHLLRELQERFWASLYPEIKDGDAEFRAGSLEGLNAKLPLFIREIAVTQSINEEHYSWLHWDESRRVDNLGRQNQQEALEAALADGKITGEQFDRAVTATPRAYYETLFEDLQQSWEECELLDRLVDGKFGREAPSLIDIKNAIEDCHGLVEGIIKKKRELEPDLIRPFVEPEHATGEKPEPLPTRSERPNGPVSLPSPAPSGTLPLEPQDRADALRRLAAVAAYFRRTEPHSPVAYLVQRAVRWGEMPLEQWLQEVIKSEDVLSHVRETLGLDPSRAENGTTESEQ